MFDFAPVGLVCACVGLVFIAAIGWRLIPGSATTRGEAVDRFELSDYIAEVRVPEESAAIGKLVRHLDDVAEDNEAAVIGLIRRGRRMPGMARRVEIRQDDILVVEAGPDAIDSFVGALGLEYVRRKDDGESFLTSEDLSLVEVVVPPGARIAGRSALSLQLLHRHGITLLGVSRRGRSIKERVRKATIVEGDVLLLLGPTDAIPDVVHWLGCLPLAERGLQLVQRRQTWLTVSIFAVAILAASLRLVYLPVALGVAAGLMVLLNIVPPRQIYESVEWPVIVLLGSMIPIGTALETTGGAQLIAEGIVSLARDLSPALVLALLMVITMTLSDVMNNVATAVMAAPVAVDIAVRLQVSPDPFLMGVAVAASCAFLTPIGHKNNTLILGPGGYRFGDYWRMGLPLEILVIAVSVPTLLVVWPLTGSCRRQRRRMRCLKWARLTT